MIPDHIIQQLVRFYEAAGPLTVAPQDMADNTVTSVKEGEVVTPLAIPILLEPIL